MSVSILSKPLPTVNTAVLVILTDGKSVYDQRCIDPADLPWLNQIAQETTDGELWWEVRATP